MVKYGIQQWSRTALFAKVSPCAESIVSLLCGVKNQESIADEEIQLVEHHLLVHNLEEFEEKFPAVLYFGFVNNQIVFFEDKSDGLNGQMIHECKLTEVKGIWQVLFPDSCMNVEKRKELAYRLFCNPIGVKKLKKLRRKIGELLSEKAQLDSEQNLQILEEIQESMYDIRSIFPLFIEDIELPENTKVDEKVYDWLSEKLLVSDEQVVQNIDNNIYVESREWKEVLLAVFCPGMRGAHEIERALYSRMYDKVVQDFYRIAKGILEIRLGVQAYFAQGRGVADNMELMVFNASPEELTLPHNKKVLDVFFRTVNTKSNFRSTIWTGILPEVCMTPHLKKNIRKYFLTNEHYEPETIDKETVYSLLELTGKYQIVMFYQYETRQIASNQAFANKGNRKFMEAGYFYEDSRFDRYISCCYPNLTILEEEEWYIGAAFVTAGMFAAFASNRFLQTYYDNLVEEDVGALFDIEANGNYGKVTTTLPKELHSYSSQTKSDIQKRKYGCMLVSEDGLPGWGKIPNMMLLCARTLAFREGRYESVCVVLSDIYEERKSWVAGNK